MHSSEIVTPNVPITLLCELQVKQNNGVYQGQIVSFEKKTWPSWKDKKRIKATGKIKKAEN